MISHTGEGSGYIDMSSDQELDPDQLPRGHTPIWIQPPPGTSEIAMMERVLQIPELKQYKNNVTVLCGDYGKDDKVMEICDKIGYKYIYAGSITGVEDQVIILLNTNVYPEFITRGINMLIIVNNGYSQSERHLQTAFDHDHKRCEIAPSCQYNYNLIDSRPW